MKSIEVAPVSHFDPSLCSKCQHHIATEYRAEKKRMVIHCCIQIPKCQKPEEASKAYKVLPITRPGFISAHCPNRFYHNTSSQQVGNTLFILYT